MNPNEPIHEHCCIGENINFDVCDATSHFQTGNFLDANGNPTDANGIRTWPFCRVFFREDSLKNDVNKRGLISR